jgi:type IV secretion system protein VirD4
VLSTALSFLSLYRDPVVAEVTSVSDWTVEGLVIGERPMSLYLACPPSDVSRTKPLMRLVLNQIARRLTEQEPDPSRRKLLLMLDEFPALGRLDFFETALAFMAGYGVRAFLVAQSLNQIEKAYGPNNAILDNCHVRVAFATNDERTAKRISEALGTKTELRSQKNYTGHRLSPWLSHMMVSRQETQRALLTPGEIMQLPATDEIVMVSGAPPVRAKKLRYFVDGNFTCRVLPPASVSREASPASHDWRETVACRAVTCRAVQGADNESDGGVELQPELDLPEARLPIDLATDEAPDIEDANVSEQDAHLRNLRRAVAIDRGDKNFLPDF